MKIFLLERIENRPKFDVYNRKMVRAKTERRARELANINIGDEGKIWTDENLVSCQVITKNEGASATFFSAAA